MRALALTHRCVALDLPGHGKTLVTSTGVLRRPGSDLHLEVAGSNPVFITVAVVPNSESTGSCCTADVVTAFCKQLSLASGQHCIAVQKKCLVVVLIDTS